MDTVLERIAEEFSHLESVCAVALSGSMTSQIHDELSDYDIYVYADRKIGADERKALLERLSPEFLLSGMSFFEPGDEMMLEGNVYDIMYRDSSFPHREIERVWIAHQPSLGYSTCFLHNLRTHRILFDRTGALGKEIGRLDSTYPDELAESIISFNCEMMAGQFSSNWIHQVENAVRRGDLISINHRTAALMASYFDILFAANRVLPPGEKKIAGYVHLLCHSVPEHFDEDIAAIYTSLDGNGLIGNLSRAIDRLYGIL